MVDDGSGEWLALAPGRNGLTRDNGFEDLADILINTRLAADVAGAMGRCRSGLQHPTALAAFPLFTPGKHKRSADPAAVGLMSGTAGAPLSSSSSRLIVTRHWANHGGGA